MAGSAVLTAHLASARETPLEAVDRAVEALHARKTVFARLPPMAKARLLEECITALRASAPAWIEAACRMKGLDPSEPRAGEEWLGGPMVVARNLRLLVESLHTIAREGRPSFGAGARLRKDGRLEVRVFPTGPIDSAILGGIEIVHLYPAGVTAVAARQAQAAFYQEAAPEGGVAAVLGAGNVTSIPPTDALYKLFVEGEVVALKMNPVNEAVGPALERAFAPLVREGFLAVLYGGADVGARLVSHPRVTSVHLTGSDKTHDAIVFGRGEEQAARKAEKRPLLTKRVTSELGNVTPVAVVPGRYTDRELETLASSLASMVANNASFNCNAAKLLVLGAGWPQREALVARVKALLAELPPRKAYYPGAQERYRALTGGRDRVTRIGEATPDALPWTLIEGVAHDGVDEPLFRTEPFCAILTETSLPAAEPEAFLAQVVPFLNDRVWGTLSMTIVAPDALRTTPSFADALEAAIGDLRYGCVALNHWSALGFGAVSCAWGAHPSSTLEEVRSGIGWVHNTYMLEGFEKVVIRTPLARFPKPAWFAGHKTQARLGAKLFELEATGSWRHLPGVALMGLLG